MHPLSAVVLPLLLTLGLAFPAMAADFVPGTEDVPVMPGLDPVADSALVFDKPQGRIVEAQFRGKLNRERIAAFYAETLPQLGWQAAGADSWQREGEILHLEFGGTDGDVTVGFSLSPR
jgi:hypothetical protein